MNNIFQKVQPAKVQRSAFNLSHERKLSTRFGLLTPVLLQEVVPGDKFTINTASMIRMMPMISPVMHRINTYIHYFYVPNRILDENWEKIITGDLQSQVPQISLDAVANGSLADNLGLPSGSWNRSNKINAYPFRAYYKIWNEYYRDQNQQAEIDINELRLGGTMDGTTDIKCPLMNRAWEKDYFTSALPWLQKGNPVKLDAEFTYKDEAWVTNHAGGTNPVGQLEVGNPVAGFTATNQIIDSNTDAVGIENMDQIQIDINDLRLATRLQRFLERSARAGTRYAEHLLAHWNIRIKDERLQRPEYIGGGKSPMMIGEVLNTSDTANAPQGNMAGHGIGVGGSNYASKFVPEHGYIIAIMSIMPEANYYQGLPKHWYRKLNLDFYYPEFAQLGEQEVKNSEIWYNDQLGASDTTFGYQSRYAEYKYMQSTIHGEFRGTLDFWHMARKFATQPNLNAAFITPEADRVAFGGLNRIFAVPSIMGNDEDTMVVQLYHSIKAVRPMPYHNNPTL